MPHLRQIQQRHPMMSMQRTRLCGLIAAMLASAAMQAAAQAPPPLVFNTTTPGNDLQGTLAARIQFAQSQILPARLRDGDQQPYLTGLRTSLLMVQPLQADGVTPMSVTALDGAGNALGTLNLNPPTALPFPAYHVEGVPDDGVDFTPGPGTTNIIRSSAELAKLSDPAGAFLLGRLQQNALVEIQTADGQWVNLMYLPKDPGLEGKMVRTRSNATYSSTVLYSGRQVVLYTGQTQQYKFVGGQWIREGELENNGIRYAADTWSAVLPAAWLAPGLSLQIRQGDLSGVLSSVKVGAPTELLLHTIDIGMLTTPRGRFPFASQPDAQREYFQTLPASRMIVNQYAPLWLPEVILPDGTRLTDHDPGDGAWHTGTMRQSIGKELVSLGINNANYGINSTPGQGEGSHPYLAAQVVAHNSRGNYANGIQVHGGSGGGGIATLDESLGNEFSHELGHNYSLGHFVGGFNGSVHRSADQINSSWGWDADKNRFIPNFFPNRSGQNACLDNLCQAPFDGRKFGFDSMAGGEPFSGFNRFTLYTPNSATIIQRFFEGKVVFDAASATGFSKWNAAKAQMEPYSNKVAVSDQISAPVGDLSETRLAALLADYSLVTVAMWDGNWTGNIYVPAASADNRGRVVTVDHGATWGTSLHINGQLIGVTRGFKKSYTSDGGRWNEGPAVDARVERKPRAFGVPVTTLVAYYDPDGKLPSYIFPALHGAYGFAYGDDSATVADADCQLQVQTRDGALRFRLPNHRLSAGVMNKVHINVPEADEPASVSVLCRGQTLDRKPIVAATVPVAVTVYGRPLEQVPNTGH